MRVLVVEDNPLNAELVRDLLEVGGHECALCTDGASLRRRVASGAEADLVLMDIRLPDEDGLALLAHLRAVDRFVNVPIVALTAHASTEEWTRFIEAGFDRVMTKPIDTRSFVGEVEEVWRTSSSSTTSR